MAGRTRRFTCADTRKKVTSTRLWNWRSITKSTASAWPLTRSTGSPNSKTSGGTRRKNAGTAKSPAEPMRTSMGSTVPTLPDGDGLYERSDFAVTKDRTAEYRYHSHSLDGRRAGGQL